MITGMMARRLATVEADPYWPNVYALLPFDSATNQEVSGNSAWDADSGATGSSITVLDGNYFDAVYYAPDGKNARISSSSTVALGSRDFTIECWVQMLAAGSGYKCIWTMPGAGLFTRNGQVIWYQGGAWAPSATVTDGDIYHLMVTRESGTVRVFVNGVKSATDYAGSASIATNKMYIGADAAFGSGYGNKIDEMRITLDVARETANFTPRTTPFPRSGP